MIKELSQKSAEELKAKIDEEEKRERLEMKEIQENLWRWRNKKKEKKKSKKEKEVKDKNNDPKKISTLEKLEIIENH